MVIKTVPTIRTRKWLGPGGLLNTKYHKPALLVFLFVVIAHWVEHVAQAAQIYVFGWERPRAGGVLGLAFPWLVTSEWLHYGFAVVMLIAFVVLRHGFVGRAQYLVDGGVVDPGVAPLRALPPADAGTDGGAICSASRCRRASRSSCSLAWSCICSTTRSCSCRWLSRWSTTCAPTLLSARGCAADACGRRWRS